MICNTFWIQRAVSALLQQLLRAVQLWVRVTHRPNCACRYCAESVVVAAAQARPMDGAMPTEALITHLTIRRFCD